MSPTTLRVLRAVAGLVAAIALLFAAAIAYIIGHNLAKARECADWVKALLAEPDGDTVGKRLDFLLQEIMRETNTVNSKPSDLELSRLALALKAESEKVREQIQNLE